MYFNKQVVTTIQVSEVVIRDLALALRNAEVTISSGRQETAVCAFHDMGGANQTYWREQAMNYLMKKYNLQLGQALDTKA